MEALAEELGRDRQSFSRFGSGEFENLAQDVGRTMGAVETLEHAGDDECEHRGPATGPLRPITAQ